MTVDDIVAVSSTVRVFVVKFVLVNVSVVNVPVVIVLALIRALAVASVKDKV